MSESCPNWRNPSWSRSADLEAPPATSLVLMCAIFKLGAFHVKGIRLIDGPIRLGVQMEAIPLRNLALRSAVPLGI